MTTLHATSVSNVEASINKYFRDTLTALTRPAVLSTMPAVNENMPDAPAVLPAFSLWHLPVASMDIYQGRQGEKGVSSLRELGILDLSAWVSRKASTSWNAQLRAMRSMIDAAYLDSKAGIIIKDYLTDPTNPQPTNYRVVLVEKQAVTVQPDVNPDVQRIRVLVHYQWHLRSSN